MTFVPIYIPNLANFHKMAQDLLSGKKQANRLERQVDQLTEMVRDLGESLDAQRTMGTALWELLQETGALDGDSLLAKIQEVDKRQDTELAQSEAEPGDCPGCTRKLHFHRRTCLYCGEANPSYDSSLFHG